MTKNLPNLPLETILSRFTRKGDDECWPWSGRRGSRGYGRFTTTSRTRKSQVFAAHRLVYAALKGPIPDGMQLDHLCRNRMCVNPSHLEPVTARENTRRGISVPGVNSRKTHCIRGHSFSEANTRLRANGSRQCRTCDRLHAAANYIPRKKIATA